MSGDVDCFEDWASRPFKPARLRRNGAPVEIGDRVVEALEYIAAQLGEICRKMDHVGADARPTREDIEEMKDLLRKL